MVMITDVAARVCPTTLRITADITVPCALNPGHGQHTYPGGADNFEPRHHQAVWDGKVYVWTTKDAGVINTLRNAGFHTQCDHEAAKLAVVVTP
jgi:hypothetical protein